MSPIRLRFVMLPLLLSAGTALAGDASNQRALQLNSQERDVRSLAAAIDLHLGIKWRATETTPTTTTTDAEYLRRVSLALTGRIPTVSAARAFLADKAPDKRRRLVEELLASPAYVAHMVHVWRATWLPEAGNNPQLQAAIPGFEAWLRQRVSANIAYDQMVRDLLTAPFTSDNRQMRERMMYDQEGASPAAFYVARESKPEALAAVTSRFFLGVRIECAQCHDHPMASWKREQFWQFAAFFAGFSGRSQLPREMTGTREITIPGKEQVVPALFLDGKEPTFAYKVSNRVPLADWITAADNPWFAQAAVNRIWAQFFGIGLVDPIDDFGEEHPASHPELLEHLARAFVRHNYDLKFLMRAIVSSQAYQLSSRVTDPKQEDPRLFARMAVKSLSPEQLYDSVVQATGFWAPAQEGTPRSPVDVMRGPRAEFLSKFANQEQRSDAPTTILQALFFMNSRFVAELTDPNNSRTLSAIADAPFLTPTERIDTVFLATLSRLPSEKERTHFEKYVAASNDPARALGDVFWALLNSAEFSLDH